MQLRMLTIIIYLYLKKRAIQLQTRPPPQIAQLVGGLEYTDCTSVEG